MTYDWDELKPEICELYLVQGFTLDAVAEIVNKRHGIDARQRTYREKLREWGCRKTDHRARRRSQCSAVSLDSGYSSQLSNISNKPTLSRTTSSSTSSWHASSATLTPSIHSVHSGYTDNQSLLEYQARSPSIPGPKRRSSKYLDRPLPPLPTPPKGEIVLQPSPSTDTVAPKAILAPSSTVPLHHPSSQCPRARNDAEVPRVAFIGKCQYCGATKLHSLMVGGFSTSIANFRLVVEAEKASINVKDIFGNTCLHSAAVSGLGVEDFQILHTAGADLLARNNKGETFLHLLHQHHNGNTLFRILEWAMLQNIDMKIATYDGKSIIHAICERYISFPALMNMWPFFKGLGPAINLRDRAGHTPVDFLRASLIKPLTQTSPSETLHSNVESLFTKNLPDYQPSDNHTSALQHFSTTEILRSDALMLEIVRSSEHTPLTENPDGRNALHCLAYIIRYPEYPDHTLLPPTARHDRVAACLRWSVPVNAYDRHGQTPLHSFLAHPRSNDNDLSLAATVELLLHCGADPCMKDRSGNTALHLACNHGKIACVEVLLRFLKSNSKLYDNAIRVRNDANRTPVMETIAWMPMHDPQERRLREQCVQLIFGKEYTEDDVKAGFWGISNSQASGPPVVEVAPETTQTQIVPSQPEEVVLEAEAEVPRPASPMVTS